MSCKFLFWVLLIFQVSVGQNNTFENSIRKSVQHDLHSKSSSLKDSVLKNPPYKLYNLAFESSTIQESKFYDASPKESLFNLGTFYLKKQDYDLAKYYLYKSLNISLELQDFNFIYKTYLELAKVHAKLYENPKSLEFSHKIINSKDNEAKHLVGKAWANLGSISLEQNKIKESYHNFQNSLKVSEVINDSLGILTAYVNIALIENKRNDINSSMIYLDKALKINGKLQNDSDFATIYYLYGANLNKLKLYKESLDFLEKSFLYYKILLCEEGSAQVLLEKAISYLNLDQDTHALSLIGMSLDIARRSGNLVLQSKSYEILSNYNADNKNYNDALYYEKLFHKLEDSIFKITKNRESTKLQLQYDFDKKQAQLDAEHKLREKEIELEIEQNNAIIRLVYAGVAMVILFLILLLYNLRRNNIQRQFIDSQVRTLEIQNRKIQKSILEKDSLIKEIHHRVKNNLQVVYSLLTLQSDSLQSEVQVNSLGSSINRIQAMSLIHQNLYQSSDVDKVDFGDYLKDLIKELLKENPSCKDLIRFENFTNELKFRIQTSIPLGLIISELLNISIENNLEERIIKISLLQNASDTYQLLYSDSVSSPKFASNLNLENSSSLNLIKILVRQLKGHLIIEESTIEIIFKSIDN